MNVGKTLFAKLMDFLLCMTFARYVQRYGGDNRVRTLPCTKPLRITAFARLTYAAKAAGDASWLAFKAYGHPRAKRA